MFCKDNRDGGFGQEGLAGIYRGFFMVFFQIVQIGDYFSRASIRLAISVVISPKISL
jgi:hypothetical protein